MTRSLREATQQDAAFLLDLRNQHDVREASVNTQVIDWGTHVAWLHDQLTHPDRRIWVVVQQGGDAGSVRLDATERDVMVSVAVAQGYRKQGTGLWAITEATRIAKATWPNRRIRALIRLDNVASARVFTIAGYKIQGAQSNPAALIYQYQVAA